MIKGSSAAALEPLIICQRDVNRNFGDTNGERNGERSGERTVPDATHLSVFDNLYTDMPAELAEQRAEFEAFLADEATA